MLCDVCKQNEAKVHLTQMQEGEIKKIDLCESCSKAKGVDDSESFSLTDLLDDENAKTTKRSVGEATCSQCGFTQADFKKQGRLGCPECYNAFADGLEGLLKTMHKSTRHAGKVPQALRQTQDLSNRLKGLEKKLEKAIATEEFETAVRLRDEIRDLRSQLQEVAPS